MKNNSRKANIKMLIVDDEPVMRQGLKCFFDWEEYGIGEIFEADDSRNAIRAAKDNPPDIVISDIRMPDMDGLELINKLKKIIPHGIFVIISGYNDFEYAKQAISLGVIHYMIKPVFSAELHQVMLKCVEKVREVEYIRDIEAKLDEKLKETLPLLQHNYMLNIINGEIDDEDVLAKIDDLNIDIANKTYSVFLIKVFCLMQKNFDRENKINLLVFDKLKKYFSNFREENFKYYMLHDIGIVKAVVSHENKLKAVNILIDTFNMLKADICSLFNIEIICSVGSFVYDISEINVSSSEAYKILEHKSLKAESGITFYEDIQDICLVYPFLLFKNERKKLIHGIEVYNTNDIKNSIQEIKKKINKLEYFSKQYFYSTILEIIMSAYRFVYDRGYSIEECTEVKLITFDFLDSFNHMDDFFIWIEDFFIELADRFNAFKQNKSSQVIDHMKKYIDENIQEEISLNKLSEIFYYNPSYLSRLFKEDTGKNFLEYLNETKIEHAKKMLLTSNMTAGKVCGEVGYKDYKYFVSMFRKITGITPYQYRKGKVIEP